MKPLITSLVLLALTGCIKSDRTDQEPGGGDRVSPRLLHVPNAPHLCVVVYTQSDDYRSPVAMVSVPCPTAEVAK